MLYSIGEIIDDVTTGGANFSESDTDHRITVPSNERWIPLMGTCDRDVSATINITVHNKSDTPIWRFITERGTCLRCTEKEFYVVSFFHYYWAGLMYVYKLVLWVV